MKTHNNRRFRLDEKTSVELELVDKVWEHLGILGVKLIVAGRRGWPDRMFLIPGGRPLLVECKRPGQPPRPNQIENHEYLRLIGYNVEVVDDALDGFDAVCRAVEAAPLSEKEREILIRARRWRAATGPRMG